MCARDPASLCVCVPLSLTLSVIPPVQRLLVMGEGEDRGVLERTPASCLYVSPALGYCVKTSPPLLCTASAFSERYLGMPLRDDSRYQVCVYFLPSLDLLKLFTAAPDTPAAQLFLHFPRLLSKSEPATLSLVSFQRSTGFCNSLRFVASVHQITGCRISGLEMLSHQSC